MKSSTITLRVFGVLRHLASEDGFITIPDSSEIKRVDDLKSVIKNLISTQFPNFDASLIDQCAIASQSEILYGDAELASLQGLAVLPPVCGG